MLCYYMFVKSYLLLSCTGYISANLWRDECSGLTWKVNFTLSELKFQKEIQVLHILHRKNIKINNQKLNSTGNKVILIITSCTRISSEYLICENVSLRGSSAQLCESFRVYSVAHAAKALLCLPPDPCCAGSCFNVSPLSVFHSSCLFSMSNPPVCVCTRPLPSVTLLPSCFLCCCYLVESVSQTWVKTSLHINTQLEICSVCCFISRCFPVRFHRGIKWCPTFIDLCWQPRINGGTDSWCRLQQSVINTNNQIAFVTDSRAN